jgi:hypothetical protein
MGVSSNRRQTPPETIPAPSNSKPESEKPESEKPESEKPGFVPRQLDQSAPGVSLGSYVRPAFQDAQKTNSSQAWCSCRESCSVCVSKPHVGQDFNSQKEPDRSLAISNGTIKEIGLLSSSCGYFILFEDSMGAQWYILHANKPTDLSEGQVVPRASLLGIHSQYPSGGCGSGAHIHLERRTSGKHEGAARSKDCGRGTKSCYFDPISVFEGKINVTTEEQRLKLVSESKESVPSKSLSLVENSASEEVKPPLSSSSSKLNSINCSSLQAIPFPHPPLNASQDPGETSLEVVLVLSENQPGVFKMSLRELFLAEKGTQNKSNSCVGRDCIHSYQIFSPLNEQNWALAVESTGLQNQPIEISPESKLCLKANLGQSVLVQVQTQAGLILEKEIPVGGEQ